jgi:ABC-type transporter Mla subunit MlaD
MTYAGWYIDELRFTGADDKKALLEFAPGLTIVYGASNTGKSFALKVLDFMLGGSKPLPNIDERKPYNKAWLRLTLPPDRTVTLERGIVGGAFKLHERGAEPSTLNPKHDPNNPANISTFLLRAMDATRKKVSVDAAGTHSNLTFRDIAGIVLTNEIAIQSENSPIESGERGDITRERNVLKYILTGEDDSAIVPIAKRKDFNTGRTAKAAILQDLIDQLNVEIGKDYPDPDGLADQGERINATLRQIETELSAARSSIRALLDQKRQLSSEISVAERRGVDIALSLDSFEQLEAVYASDIKRLEGLEEAGFLLRRDASDPCPVCGAPPESQVHSHGLEDIEDVRAAAEIEIHKIKQQRGELAKTVADTKGEAENLIATIAKMRGALGDVELKLEEATPNADEQQRKLGDVVEVRDHVRRGLDLLKRRDTLIKLKEEIQASKAPKRDDTIQRGLSTQTAKALSDVVSAVLKEWGFPGKHEVVFDLNTYDLIIDGKERRNNGKGVRAITHAAFKVALLLYCREHGLPHPGFLVLDTPLLTYRDPMKKQGDTLTEDEEEIRKTDLKDRFFKHLGKIGGKAQFIVFENVDPPAGIESYCKVEAFTNDAVEGRQGLL